MISTDTKDTSKCLEAASPRKRSCLDNRLAARRLPWRAVVLDLDETTGSWGLASLAYKMFLRFAGQMPPTQMFVRHYLAVGGARPWLKEFLQTLELWKRSGRIDEVAIFTSASNAQGWVNFLGRCMEEYAGTDQLFGRYVAREDSPLASSPTGVRTVKDLSLISEDEESVVLLDDKPEFALNGYVIGVPEYAQDVCIQELEAEMKRVLPLFSNEIDQVFAADRKQHPPNLVNFSADNALANSLQVLSEMFPPPANPATPPLVLSRCRSEAAIPHALEQAAEAPGKAIDCCV